MLQFCVVVGPIPVIHVLVAARKTWMPATRPGMTVDVIAGACVP